MDTVEECELDAAELLLKCLYKAELPEEARGNGRLMLQVRRVKGTATLRYPISLHSQSNINTSLTSSAYRYKLVDMPGHG